MQFVQILFLYDNAFYVREQGKCHFRLNLIICEGCEVPDKVHLILISRYIKVLLFLLVLFLLNILRVRARIQLLLYMTPLQ